MLFWDTQSTQVQMFWQSQKSSFYEGEHMNDIIIGAVVRAQNGWMRLRDEEQGQGLVEYALIIAIVALGVILAIVFLRNQIRGLFEKAGSELSTQPGS